MSDIPRADRTANGVRFDEITAPDIPRAALPEDMIEAAKAGVDRCFPGGFPLQDDRAIAREVLDAAGVPALLEERDRLRELVQRAADILTVCGCEAEARSLNASVARAVRDGD